jgi:hypothetical protein
MCRRVADRLLSVKILACVTASPRADRNTSVRRRSRARHGQVHGRPTSASHRARLLRRCEDALRYGVAHEAISVHWRWAPLRTRPEPLVAHESITGSAVCTRSAAVRLRWLAALVRGCRHNERHGIVLITSLLDVSAWVECVRGSRSYGSAPLDGLSCSVVRSGGVRPCSHRQSPSLSHSHSNRP